METNNNDVGVAFYEGVTCHVCGNQVCYSCGSCHNCPKAQDKEIVIVSTTEDVDWGRE